jgi:hypothetical protein
MPMIPKYKDIVDLMKKGATVEAQEKIMELREGALELQEENFDLKEKVKKLEEAINFKESVKWEKPHYFIVNGEKKDGPYCQKCHDADEKMIRLQNGTNDFWECKQCNSKYKGQNYRQSPPISFG